MQGYIYISEILSENKYIFIFKNRILIYKKKNYRWIRIIFLKIKYTQHHKKTISIQKKGQIKKQVNIN